MCVCVCVCVCVTCVCAFVFACARARVCVLVREREREREREIFDTQCLLSYTHAKRLSPGQVNRSGGEECQRAKDSVKRVHANSLAPSVS